MWRRYKVYLNQRFVDYNSKVRKRNLQKLTPHELFRLHGVIMCNAVEGFGNFVKQWNIRCQIREIREKWRVENEKLIEQRRKEWEIREKGRVENEKLIEQRRKEWEKKEWESEEMKLDSYVVLEMFADFSDLLYHNSAEEFNEKLKTLIDCYEVCMNSDFGRRKIAEARKMIQ